MPLPEVVAHFKPSSMVQLTQKGPDTPEARSRTRWESERGNLVEIIGDTATFNLNGDVFQSPNVYTYYGYGFSTEEVAAIVQTLPPAVSKIRLSINSGGGDVWGTHALSQAIFEARAKYDITVIVSSLCASAAYWIASAAHRILLTEPTVYLGSIGVYSVHYDFSQAYEKEGVKITEITAGEYKGVGSPLAPLTEDAQMVLQDRVNALYAIFLEDVARNRGGTAQTVHTQMGEGKIFIGQQAIDAGLADGFLSEFSGGVQVSGPEAKEPDEQVKTPSESMDETAIQAAVKAERARVASIRSLAIAGYEDPINSGIDQGLSAGEVAINLVKAIQAQPSEPKAQIALANRILQQTSAQVAESSPERPGPEPDPFSEKLSKSTFDESALSAKFQGNYVAYCRMFDAMQRQRGK